MDKTWLETCVTAGEFLYGEFPREVLLKLYNTKYSTKGVRLGIEDIESYDFNALMMDYDGEMFTPMIVTEGETLELLREVDKKGNPYASLHFDPAELKTMRKEQSIVADQGYWIPTEEQIRQLVNEGYIRTPGMAGLEDEIKRRGGDPEYLKLLWPQVSSDKMDATEAANAVVNGMLAVSDDREGIEIAADKAVSVSTSDDFKTMMPAVYGFLNNINLRARKGWPPEELIKKMPKKQGAPTIVPGSVSFARMLKGMEPELTEMGVNVDYGSLDSFATIGQYGERRMIKVGRNDPCPCGSGKKYKRCHGR